MKLFLSTILASLLFSVAFADDCKKSRGRRLIQFLGEGTLLPNGLDDANTMAGTSVTFQEASTIHGLEETGSYFLLGCWKLPDVDIQSKEQIGIAVDCVYPLPDFVNSLLISFHIIDGEGSVVTTSLSTVGPVPEGPYQLSVNVDDPSAPLVTTISGSMPNGPDTNQIMAGTGCFEGTSGNARLSGYATFLPGNPGLLYLNCMWELNIFAPPGNDCDGDCDGGGNGRN